MEERRLIRENERLDDLQNGYMLIQDPSQFCFGIDAVLLSWFAKVKPGEKVLDMGTGTGIVPILLKARYPQGKYIGLEIQEESADMARRSVAYNHLEKDIAITLGDIKEASGIYGSSVFDVVVSNPPYMIGSHGLTGGNQAKTIARHETCLLWRIFWNRAQRCFGPGEDFIWSTDRSVWPRSYLPWFSIRSNLRG